jgi:TRAP-type C4-dicarboxylate transport system permease small subunit
MRTLDSLIMLISRIFLWSAAAALMLMTTLVIIAASMRYLVGKPFDFTEEVVALLYICVVFTVLPMTTLQGQHITVSILPQRLARGLHRPIGVAAGLVMIAFCSWFAIEAYYFMAVSQEMGSKSEQVGILLWPWMALIPFGTAVSTLISVRLLVKFVSAPTNANPSVAAPAADPL